MHRCAPARLGNSDIIAIVMLPSLPLPPPCKQMRCLTLHAPTSHAPCLLSVVVHAALSLAGSHVSASRLHTLQGGLQLVLGSQVCLHTPALQCPMGPAAVVQLPVKALTISHVSVFQLQVLHGPGQLVSGSHVGCSRGGATQRVGCCSRAPERMSKGHRRQRLGTDCHFLPFESRPPESAWRARRCSGHCYAPRTLQKAPWHMPAFFGISFVVQLPR